MDKVLLIGGLGAYIGGVVAGPMGGVVAVAVAMHLAAKAFNVKY